MILEASKIHAQVYYISSEANTYITVCRMKKLSYHGKLM